MKNLFILLTIFTTFAAMAQSVGINADGSSANTSAMLDVSSTTKGFLPPRMTFLQRQAIVSPATVLMIYCTNCSTNGEMQVYNGSSWTNMIGGSATASTTVTIGGQIWQSSNLDVATYRNGDVIPQVTDAAAWGGLTTGAWCYYNNDPANGAIYGKLYNWHAVNDPRGLAPTGWHIPTDAEWTTLTTTLGGASIAGGKMKSVGITLWTTPNNGATNESEFTGLPGGYRHSNGSSNSIRSYGYWWSSSEATTSGFSLYLSLGNGSSTANRNSYRKVNGLSVRCLRD
jgi:uncharacterized protein (TIGR02145 family)